MGFTKLIEVRQNMISDKGGGGISHFLILADKVGGGLDPPIFGWHNMWTAPNGRNHCVPSSLLPTRLLGRGYWQQSLPEWRHWLGSLLPYTLGLDGILILHRLSFSQLSLFLPHVERGLIGEWSLLPRSWATLGWVPAQSLGLPQYVSRHLVGRFVVPVGASLGVLGWPRSPLGRTWVSPLWVLGLGGITGRMDWRRAWTLSCGVLIEWGLYTIAFSGWMTLTPGRALFAWTVSRSWSSQSHSVFLHM